MVTMDNINRDVVNLYNFLIVLDKEWPKLKQLIKEYDSENPWENQWEIESVTYKILDELNYYIDDRIDSKLEAHWERYHQYE